MAIALAPVPLCSVRASCEGRHARQSARASEISDLFVDRPTRFFAPGSTLLLHGGRADDFFQVVSGTVRCCTITEDGRRFIFRFVQPGEFIGFTDFERWHFTAEAIDHVGVLSARRETVEQKLAVNPLLQREVRRLASRELAAREQQLVILSYARANERLMWFLRAFANSFDRDGYSYLPMTRQDIGDHLGMTLETVSRVFGALKRRGLIEMRGSDCYRIVRQDQRSAA